VVDNLNNFINLKKIAEWSPFEWSSQPEYLDLLSFSGFFGSIKCFKHLLIRGFEINHNVVRMVECSGCLDLFYLSQGQLFITSASVCKAAAFCHLSLLVFMIENGAEINAKGFNHE